MKPWSKLQREIYKIFSDDINIQIHCAAYRMDSARGSASLPRYRITLDKEIIWDYPKQFSIGDGGVRNLSGSVCGYPYNTDVPKISDLIRSYIDTPKDEIFDRIFEDDY